MRFDPQTRRLSLHSKGRVVQVPADEIEALESSRNYVVVHCRDGRHVVRATLEHAARQLAELKFLRVHRRFLVNPARVRGRRGDTLELASGLQVRLSREIATQFKNLPRSRKRVDGDMSLGA